MDSLSYKTTFLNTATTDKVWVIVDAENFVLGRLASEVAMILRGKHKAGYTPHVDCGDNVIIVNSAKIKLTGNKMTEKVYVRHTGYPGGQRVTTPAELLAKDRSELIIQKAVKGMLPKNRLGRALLKNLRVYPSTEHVHEGQTPKTIKLNS